MYSLVVFSIIPSLKKNRSTCVMTHDDVKCILHKIMSAEFSPLNAACAKINLAQASTNQ